MSPVADGDWSSDAAPLAFSHHDEVPRPNRSDVVAEAQLVKLGVISWFMRD